MTPRYVIVGWFLAGLLVGGVLFAVLTTSGFAVEKKMPIVDLAQLAATVLLALYIPLAIERYRDRTRSVRALLVDDVNHFMAVVRGANGVVTSCTHSGKTTDHDRMRIRTAFLSANAKVGRLEKRLFDVCPEQCKDSYYPFKDAYTRYWKSVTDGDLYASGTIDWEFWRKQEFAFASLEHRSAELVRYLTTS